MIKITVTDQAKAKLADYIKIAMESDRYRSLLPAVLRVAGTDDAHAEWDIGFYERGKVPEEWNIIASGIEINIDPYWQPLLDGKTIDYIDNKFKIS